MDDNYYSRFKVMADLSYVSRFRWNPELGEKLKTLRGKVSRRELAEKVRNSGQDCSHQYLQKIEDGRADSIGLELLQALCKELGAEVGDIIPTLSIQLPKEFTTRG